jgi:hypothetical protein
MSYTDNVRLGSKRTIIGILMEMGFGEGPATAGYELADTGCVRFHRSGDNGVTVYRVGGHFTTRDLCVCPAGQHDTPCKHRAAVLLHEVEVYVKI